MQVETMRRGSLNGEEERSLQMSVCTATSTKAVSKSRLSGVNAPKKAFPQKQLYTKVQKISLPNLGNRSWRTQQEKPYLIRNRHLQRRKLRKQNALHRSRRTPLERPVPRSNRLLWR